MYNDTSHISQARVGVIAEKVLSSFVRVSNIPIAVEVSLQLRQHFLGHFERLKAIFGTAQCLLSLSDLVLLINYEFLLLSNLLLNLIIEQHRSCVVLLTDIFELLEEAIDRFRRLHIEEVIAALSQQIVQFPLAFFDGPYLVGEWENNW